MEHNAKLSVSVGEALTDPLQYRRLVGKLMYLTLTCLYITFAANTLSVFMKALTNIHLQATYKILRYLKAEPGKGLFYRSSSDLSVKAYCDLDWAGCIDTRKSVTGFCVILRQILIS